MERLSILSQLLWFLSTCLLAVKGSNFEFRDFLAKNRLSDGELEIRIRFKGVTAKETTVSGRNNTGITFRQLTDGQHFIQLIYDSSSALRDCEFMDKDPQQIDNFLKTFSNDLDRLEKSGNVSVVALENEQGLPGDMHRWLKYGKMKNRCRKVQLRLRKDAERRDSEVEDGGRHHHNNQIEDNHQKTRHRRSITFITANSKRILGGLRKTFGWQLRQQFLFPGMQWCGMADRAKKYTDIGEYMDTDRCCRKHDVCKLAIPPNDRKFQMYNSSPFTRTHCQCDRSFRTCLKMVDTSDSNLIGKIFFNVVQTKCFILKPKKICIRRSWWGKKCLKWKVTKKAILKDNKPY